MRPDIRQEHLPITPNSRHCEERRDEAIQGGST
jgi:hypothetical protein